MTLVLKTYHPFPCPQVFCRLFGNLAIYLYLYRRSDAVRQCNKPDCAGHHKMLHCIPTPCQSTSLSTMRHLVTQNCRFAYCITLSFCYLCSNKFRHASRRTAYQGGTFALYGFMEYTKQPIDYPQQIQMLKERGLMIDDEKRALEQLRIISYFRLANYLRPMEQDKVTHIFKPNSTFENALDLNEKKSSCHKHKNNINVIKSTTIVWIGSETK